MRIAVDAMGGDYAPGVVVEGVARALYDFDDEIVLVGHTEKLSYYLAKYGIGDHPRLRLVHADTAIEMSDQSTAVIRGKKDSSMAVCARLMKAGDVEGIVSAGHTGAAVASTKVLVRTLPGVDRPAIGASLPQVNGRFLLVDAGANTECEFHHLVQFAVMGEVYARYLLGVDKPRVGLLSVGGEDQKGNDLTKQTFKFLSELPINFVGNVEGDSVFEDVVDVVISDGFSGNVLLKTAEGLSKASMHWIRQVFKKNAMRYTGAMLAKNAFRELKAYGDADLLGGAPLLGLNGICIIGHGSSSPTAVRNAIRVAGECGSFGLNDQICKRINETHTTTAELLRRVGSETDK